MSSVTILMNGGSRGSKVCSFTMSLATLAEGNVMVPQLSRMLTFWGCHLLNTEYN